MKYSEKLRDPRWQRKRLLILERDKWRCQSCGDKTKPLNVHHAYYEYGAAPWEAHSDALYTLCEACHEPEHEEHKQAVNYVIQMLAGVGIRTARDLCMLQEMAILDAYEARKKAGLSTSGDWLTIEHLIDALRAFPSLEERFARYSADYGVQ